jgi:ApbE superfamily uncharacterized protein (UPF0280 family)
MRKNRWTRHHIERQETIITLLCGNRYRSTAERAAAQFRNLLTDHIRRVPAFLTSHQPLLAPEGTDARILQMYEAASRTGVGPMASVAGAFADAVLQSLLAAGAPEAVADNGGDIALFITEPVRIGIYAGNASVKRLAFHVEPAVRPLGICTSSGTVGHSFSYGRADAAVVISDDVILADAAATALGNRVKDKSDLTECFKFMDDIGEIQGAMVILDDQVAMYGTLPELVETDVDETLITRGQLFNPEHKHV